MSDRRHVLVAEDEALAAIAIEDFLSRKGYRVTLAGDGQEAVERLRDDPADIVITDLRMPRLDGRGLIRELRGMSPTLPVIVMTGYLTAESADDALTNGAWRPLEILRKPVSPQAILDTLERMLNGAA
ncbi:response regulator [Azospirillum sp. TSO22-1]|uniref:response regulator n=1 Tax=Azospirillum sp. TSO22-1 TaxID=716789 RepID=UPI000D610C8D|nr:response regulator [Azospirillum sp. TSO22-1]PWC55645.1 regulator [Azospirillum sp. TSO22-1]